MYFVLGSVVFANLGTISVFGITLNQIIIVTALCLGLASRMFRKEKIYHFSQIDLWLVLFAAYLWLSNFLINNNPAWGMLSCMNYLRSLACYFIVVFLITDAKKIRLLVIAYVLASLGIVLTTNPLEAVETGLKFVASARQGLTGLADTYIFYGLYALMSIPLAYAMFKCTARKTFKIISGLIILTLSVATLFSGSRGAVVSYVITMISIIVVEARSNKQSTVASTALLSIVSVGLLTLFWIKGGRYILSTLVTVGGQGMDASMAGRLSFQKAAFSQFLSHPVFGIGIDAFKYSTLEHVPHNQWLQILTELGLVGLMISGAMTWVIFRALLSARSVANHLGDPKMASIINGVVISIFVLLFWGLYENIGYISVQKVLFMLIGLARSIETYMRKQTLKQAKMII